MYIWIAHITLTCQEGPYPYPIDINLTLTSNKSTPYQLFPRPLGSEKEKEGRCTNLTT